MREVNQNIFKVEHSNNVEYIWMVKNDSHQWEIIAKGPDYQLFGEIGVRAAAVENNELIVDILPKQTIENYISLYTKLIEEACLLEQLYIKFDLNLTINLGAENSSYMFKELKKLIDDHSFKMVSSDVYEIKNPTEDILSSTKIEGHHISIQSKFPSEENHEVTANMFTRLDSSTSQMLLF